MKNILGFEDFVNESINEAKVNNLVLNDTQAKSIWDQLKKIKIDEGDSNNYKQMLAFWDSFKKEKGAFISKIRVYSKDVTSNLLLISFDIYPIDSKEREDFYKQNGDKSIYLYVRYDVDNDKVTSAAFKEAWRMSNSESNKHTQSWFNSNKKTL